ncbi:MAG: pyridoxamine 5'-phosphate oxidase family protein [Actinomycetota bacterium]|nr:pyridoxamine 5'-phosphate oxidase family protein [Actinomycetota bacterium]
MSRRDQIRMTVEERDDFLRGRHTMNVATVGSDGRIHLVAMWYGFIADGQLAFWTYGKSQKIVNLERDPRLTCLVESGQSYDQLRGVELVGHGVLTRDRDVVQAIGESVWERYTGPVDDGAREAISAVGAKRVGVIIEVDKMVDWDHTKLAGAY